MMLSEICAEIRNYFCKPEDRIIGNFKIENSDIVPSVSIAENQYFRIVGSVFNDGVHKQGDTLTDEDEFHGAVWLMRVPQDILDLAEEIEEWQTKNADAISSPYMSESFGGYSYSKGSAMDGITGICWQNQLDFATRLKPYRRIRVI